MATPSSHAISRLPYASVLARSSLRNRRGHDVVARRLDRHGPCHACGHGCVPRHHRWARRRVRVHRGPSSDIQRRHGQRVPSRRGARSRRRRPVLEHARRDRRLRRLRAADAQLRNQGLRRAGVDAVGRMRRRRLRRGAARVHAGARNGHRLGIRRELPRLLAAAASRSRRRTPSARTCGSRSRSAPTWPASTRPDSPPTRHLEPQASSAGARRDAAPRDRPHVRRRPGPARQSPAARRGPTRASVAAASPARLDVDDPLLGDRPAVYVTDLLGRAPGRNRKVALPVPRGPTAQPARLPDARARLVLLLVRARRLDLRPGRRSSGVCIRAAATSSSFASELTERFAGELRQEPRRHGLER